MIDRNKAWSFYIWMPEMGVRQSWRGWFYKYSNQMRLSELYELKGRISAPHPKDYHIEKNVYEKNDIIEEEPEIARELELRLRRFMDNLA